jgi:DNA-binding XRE family transcriptional regulator
MIGSESLPIVDRTLIPSAPATKRADVLQWESRFRAEDVPVAEGFEDIDDVVEARERDPSTKTAMELARRRLAAKLRTTANGLAALRLRRGWSQKRLAEAIGTSQSHIARIENGRDNVLLATANELARELGVKLDDVNRALGYGKSPV